MTNPPLFSWFLNSDMYFPPKQTLAQLRVYGHVHVVIQTSKLGIPRPNGQITRRTRQETEIKQKTISHKDRQNIVPAPTGIKDHLKFFS